MRALVAGQTFGNLPFMRDPTDLHLVEATKLYVVTSRWDSGAS